MQFQVPYNLIVGFAFNFVSLYFPVFLEYFYLVQLTKGNLW